jgi:TolB-like protein/Flp pilus assembly protein TadD
MKLTEGEQAAIRVKGTDNLEVYLKVIQARELVRHHNVEDNRKAHRLLKEAIEIDPNYAPAYRFLASAHNMDVTLGISKSPRDSFKKAIEMSNKALSLDNSLGEAHGIRGVIYVFTKRYEKGISEIEKAVELEPNGADVHGYLGAGFLYTDKLDDGILVTKKAIRLNPFAPSWYLNILAAIYRSKGQYEEALMWSEKAVKQEPQNTIARVNLSSIYYLSGRIEEANLQANEVMKLNPKFSLKKLERTLPYKNPEVKRQYIDALRSAGLPYEPPLPLPDKPSIAVLAFDNLSGDPEQEYFSDGIAEDIITALSKTPKVFVIARNSSFSYKGKPVKVQEIGRELGVRYVLEGSVRKVGDKVRITAQLIDAKTGHHLWAEKYDRELGDIFAVQDEITKKVILELHIKLTHGEQARIYSKGTDNIDVYLMAMQAQWYSYLWNKNRNLEARRLVEKAIVLAPDYAYAYRILGMTHVVDIFVGLSQSPKKSLALAMDAYKKAISLDKSLASAYLGMSFVLTMLRKHDEAVSIGKKAIELEPNSADVLQGYASILTFSGMVEEAIPLFREVRRLNPIPSNSYYHSFGHALRLSGKYEEAIALQRKAIRQEPDDHLSYIILGYSASLAGRDEEAQAAVKELLRIKPNFSVTYLIAPFKDRSVLEQNCEALNKAGLSLNCDALRKTASK